MITCLFGDNKYELPNSWEELSQDQYLALVPLINRMMSGDLTLSQVRIKWVKQILGLKRVKVKSRMEEIAADNLYTLSRQVNFFYYVDYGDADKSISSEVRRMVRKTPAEDFVTTNSEIRYLQSLDYTFQLDAVWVKNLLPTLKIGKKHYQGWSATVEGGMLITDMTTQQFTQGYDLLLSINKGQVNSAMRLLVCVLYGVDQNADLVQDDVLQAVTLNFQAFVSFIFTKTRYSVLWNRDLPAKPNRKVSTGMSEAIYGLCNNGYGSYDQIEQMPLMTYLSILLSDLISSVRNMKEMDMKIDKISEKTGLPYDVIIQML